MKKSSPNLSVINLVFLFYVLTLAGHYTHRYFIIPNILIAIIYFGMLSVIYQRKDYLLFAFTSFTFLSCFFSFLGFRQINWQSLWQTWFLHKTALYLYTFLLLPSLFLTYTLNFFRLSTEIGPWSRKGILRFFLPVLVKKELIVHRYRNIMEALWERGYDTTKMSKRMLLLPRWMIPLIITTLLEGVESYDYNQMLRSDVSIYSPKRSLYQPSFFQKAVSSVLLVAILILILLRYV
jgi:hypothetical protein